MGRFFRAGRIVFLGLLALVLLIPGAAIAQGRNGAPSADRDGELLGQLGDARVYRDDETGKVSLIGASKRDAIERPAGLSASASPEVAARAHLSKLGTLFGLRDQAQQLRTEEAGVAGRGRSLAHFQQVYKGVPVLGGELNVQVNDANELLVANGEILPSISLDTDPEISAAEARQSALAKVAKDRNRQVADLNATDPELWIYDPRLLGGPGPQLTSLVWRMDVTPDGLDEFNELVLVEAGTGAVVLNFDQLDNLRDRNTYTADHGTTLPGTLVCNESNPTCTGGDADAVGAHRYAGDTYDFYSSNHGRDGIDDAGMSMVSTVHYGFNFQNAFWNGAQMVYGDGYAGADDVVGHELTHGVTQSESHLFYYYQSGAINESLSDIWGEFVDLSNTSGTDTAAVRWKLGEDLPIGAVRDMKNPTTYRNPFNNPPQPDTMRSPYYFADPGEQDNGGVHINSGVNNYAAYLMTDGGTFNGKTITSLGISKVARIYYEAQTNLLTSASDYENLYAVLQQACANLTGTAGITAGDCQEVKDAVDATEMNLQPTTAPAPEAPVCPTDQTTDLFYDDLENPSSGNWTRQPNDATNAWFYPQNPNTPNIDATYATSGTTNMWGYDKPTTGDYSIAKSTGVAIPAGTITYLRFNHSYGFEDGFDGGVIEYSTNNGSTWNDAGSLVENNGYNGTLNGGNPLGARPAFVGESNGYISTRVDLSSLAGQSVRFRFRIGTDSLVEDYGWFIDDVRVYTCPDTPPTVAEVVPAAGATQVPSGTNVESTFSERMDPSTITQNTFTLTGPDGKIVPAQVSYVQTNRKALLNPDADLANDTTYTATVKGGEAGVKDLTGHPLGEDKVWTFTTAPFAPVRVDTSPGTAAPPTTLGPYTMTPFAADSRALFQNVNDVPSPGGGTLQFDRSLGHFRLGSGWGTWSHGYTGDVYSNWSQSSPTRDRVVMTLPANSHAFYFYAEPNLRSTFNVTATASDGTTSGPVAVSGLGGAKYFGFYTTDRSTLSTITVDVPSSAQGFAIGEFGIDDIFPPSVAGVVPADGATGVSPGTNVEVTFSEAMNEASVEADGTMTLEQGTSPVTATVTYDPASKKATLDPNPDLAWNATYTATIKGGTGGAQDTAGNALEHDYSWTFSTANDRMPPSTTPTLSPEPNAAGWNKENVTLTLSATDDVSGVREISYTINDGEPVTVYQRSVQIPVTTEGRTTISYHATDNAGNAEEQQSFEVKLDKSAPTLDTDNSDGSDGITPDNKQTGVSRNVEPTATFSDEMDRVSLADSAKLYQWNANRKRWQAVPVKVSVVGETATLIPYPSDSSRLLAANKRFKVTVTTGAKNLAGISLSSAKSWTFTTGSR